MPVPVNRLHKAPAHPVVKHPHFTSSAQHGSTRDNYPVPLSAQSQFGTFPRAGRRAGIPFCANEESRHQAFSEQYPGFLQGLTVAGNAPVIKGAYAQACPPPELSGSQEYGPFPPYTSDTALDEMAIDYADLYPCEDVTVMDYPESNSVEALYPERKHEWGAFTPILEDQSPLESSQKMLSSPIEPFTPFADYVDRAITDAQLYNDQSYNDPSLIQQGQAEQSKAQPGYVVTPSATDAYKRLASPLSEWVANYIWKACVTGMGLSTGRSAASQAAIIAGPPPSQLAGSIHSMLLSTLLQPSAVFLALWYIARLPVFFGATGLGADRVKELRFRVALLGDPRGRMDRPSMESAAPFRLAILGSMLANKWLDDHTFSNKTWHTISNIPIQEINRLESLALDIFSYDLSISRIQWSQLLDHLLAYHQSLSSPSYPQPISRPSANPHSIIRKAIDDVMHAPAFGDGNVYATGPQPKFMGLAQRRAERARKEEATGVRVLGLDEDGPLPQEYLPKRRTSDAIPPHPAAGIENFGALGWPSNNHIGDRTLPPPARWSPAGDEPIITRERSLSRVYQPPSQPQYGHGRLTSHYHPGIPAARDMASHGLCWSSTCGASLPKAPSYPPTWQLLPPPSRAAPPLHARSQSLLACDQHCVPMHSRSLSQSHYDYKCPASNEAYPCPPMNPSWAAMSLLFGYPAPAHAPYPDAQFTSTWV